jgi:hypothetical protein
MIKKWNLSVSCFKSPPLSNPSSFRDPDWGKLLGRLWSSYAPSKLLFSLGKCFSIVCENHKTCVGVGFWRWRANQTVFGVRIRMWGNRKNTSLLNVIFLARFGTKIFIGWRLGDIDDIVWQSLCFIRKLLPLLNTRKIVRGYFWFGTLLLEG